MLNTKWWAKKSIANMEQQKKNQVENIERKHKFCGTADFYSRRRHILINVDANRCELLKSFNVLLTSYDSVFWIPHL